MYSLLTDVTNNWNSSEIINYVWGWVSSLATFLCSVVAAILILFIIKIGFKIAKASSENDIEERQKAINGIIWVIIGFIICCSAATGCGILAHSILS
ncbi:hypothetical protein [Spiroplasma endosymbiont of Aspidapion aeneum]|uniref:hypothetical protein n=1 Tax=Spiroplasma endosymbiont of Aspidapion aeneum TaxID=3066276 RepID=UPI00313E3C3A